MNPDSLCVCRSTKILLWHALLMLDQRPMFSGSAGNVIEVLDAPTERSAEAANVQFVDHR